MLIVKKFVAKSVAKMASTVYETDNCAAECSIENFEFIVSELVQVNPDNSRAMSALLFKLNTLQTQIVKL